MKLARLLLFFGCTLWFSGVSLAQPYKEFGLRFIQYEAQEHLVTGAWQTVRLHLANNGEDDFSGALVGYQVEPRVEGSYRVEGESYLFPLEIAKGTQKVLELKIPGRKWRALGLDIRINGIDQELGPILFNTFKTDYIPLAKVHFDARVCWVVGKKESPREFLYPVLREKKYNFEEQTPAQLPRSWLGYQSLELLVLVNESLESLDPQQARAIKAFAQMGGRILLFSGSDIATGNPIFSAFPPVGKESDFQAGFKHVLGYQISPETNHFMTPRYGSSFLLSENSTANLTGSVAEHLAPSIPAKETILILLGAFFLVALVGNRIFCSKVLRKPEMTYPIFLVCSFLYFFGVYYLGWQTEDKDIRRIESSFVYLPPTGNQMYVRSIETLISGVAQSLRDVRLQQEVFISPQSIEDLDHYYRPSIGSKISGEFENGQQGIIRQSYLKPNAVAAFCVDRLLPKSVSYDVKFLNRYQGKEEENSSDHSYYGESQNHSVFLQIRTNEKKSDLGFVLFYKDRYFYIREGENRVQKKSSEEGFTDYEIHFNLSDPELTNNYSYNSQVSYLKQIFRDPYETKSEKQMKTEIYRLEANHQDINNLDNQRLPNFSKATETVLDKIVEGWSKIDPKEVSIVSQEYGQGWVFSWQNKKYQFRKERDQLVLYQYDQVHPYCRLYVFNGSPISPVMFKGEIVSPTDKNRRNSNHYDYTGNRNQQTYSHIYVVPVEVPKEFW